MRNWKVWGSFLIGALALYLTLKNVDLDLLGLAVAHAQWIWFLPATISLGLTLVIRGWRWSALMGGTPFWMTFHANNIGYMLNMTLPLRIGEIGRAYAIKERSNVNLPGALSAIAVERILDLAAVVVLFLICAWFVPIPAQFSNAAIAATIVVTAAIVCGIVAVWQATLIQRLLARAGARFPKLPVKLIQTRFHELSSSFALLRAPVMLLTILGLTILTWLASVATQYFLFAAFLPPRLDQASFSLVMGSFAGALPAPPGGLGPVQWAATNSLVGPFKVDESSAIAFVFVSTFFQQIFLIVSGLIGLWCMRLSYDQLGRSKTA